MRAGIEPGEERPAAHRIGSEPVQAGQRDGMTFELVLTEELGRWRTIFVEEWVVG